MRITKRILFGGLAFLAAVTAAGTPALAQQTTGTPGSPAATTTIDGRYLPAPPQRFQGDIGLNAAQSKSAWPARVVPPKDAPNIPLILHRRLTSGNSWNNASRVPRTHYLRLAAEFNLARRAGRGDSPPPRP